MTDLTIGNITQLTQNQDPQTITIPNDSGTGTVVIQPNEDRSMDSITAGPACPADKLKECETCQ